MAVEGHGEPGQRGRARLEGLAPPPQGPAAAAGAEPRDPGRVAPAGAMRGVTVAGEKVKMRKPRGKGSKGPLPMRIEDSPSWLRAEFAELERSFAHLPPPADNAAILGNLSDRAWAYLEEHVLRPFEADRKAAGEREWPF